MNGLLLREVGFLNMKEKKIKLLLLGESGVGKSCILKRFADNTFSTGSLTTIGIDYRQKIIQLDSVSKLTVWDTAGQEKYRSIMPSYYKNAQAVALVYDISNEDSFLSISDWVQILKQNSHYEQLSLALIGNKSDLYRNRQVDSMRASQLALSLSLPFSEVSAKDGQGIDSLFIELARCAMLKVVKGKESISLQEGKKREGDCC